MQLIDVSTNVDPGWLAFIGLLFLTFLVFGVLGLAAPRLVWRMRHWLVRWQYRDGDRLQPSDAGLLLERFIGLVVLGVGSYAAISAGSVVIDWSAEARVQRDFEGLTTVYDLDAATATPGCAIRVVVCLRADEVFPIEPTSYQASGTELRLRLDDKFFPTHAVLDEDGRRVTVSLYGRCDSDVGGEPYGNTATDCASSRFAFAYGVVPVALDGPLGDRTLVDGHTSQPIRPSR